MHHRNLFPRQKIGQKSLIAKEVNIMPGGLSEDFAQILSGEVVVSPPTSSSRGDTSGVHAPTLRKLNTSSARSELVWLVRYVARYNLTHDDRA